MTTSSGDWADADYFARKSLKADAGQVVLPENNANWLIPLEYGYGSRTQLADARGRFAGVWKAFLAPGSEAEVRVDAAALGEPQ
jgi:hypothetical protein